MGFAFPHKFPNCYEYSVALMSGQVAEVRHARYPKHSIREGVLHLSVIRWYFFLFCRGFICINQWCGIASNTLLIAGQYSVQKRIPLLMRQRRITDIRSCRYLSRNQLVWDRLSYFIQYPKLIEVLLNDFSTTIKYISECLTCLTIIGLNSRLECLFVYGLWTSWKDSLLSLNLLNHHCTLQSFTTYLPTGWHIILSGALAFKLMHHTNPYNDVWNSHISNIFADDPIELWWSLSAG